LTVDGFEDLTSRITSGVAKRVPRGVYFVIPNPFQNDADVSERALFGIHYEFQRILDHSGIVVNCWAGALAHLGVARANALQARTSQGADGDAARVRALAAYRDFFTLWKEAHPDIPILKEAKAEYAKLQ
jgi:hypothetical protein